MMARLMPITWTVSAIVGGAWESCDRADADTPHILSTFSMGTRVVVAEDTGNHLFFFDVLGATGSLIATSPALPGRPAAILCVDGNNRSVTQGDCSDPGTLFVCMKSGESWLLSRVRVPGEQVEPPEGHPVDINCSSMTIVGKDQILIVAPELQSTGVSSFLEAFESEPRKVALLVKWPEMAGEAQTVSSFKPSAPVGAEADALAEVKVTGSSAALVFASYVGVLKLDRSGESTYEFVDLLESQDGAGPAQVSFTEDGTMLRVARPGSHYIYAGEVRSNAVQSLQRQRLPLALNQMQAFRDGREKLLVLTKPDDDGRSRLNVVEIEGNGSSFSSRLAESHVTLPAMADTLSTIPNGLSAEGARVLVWNSQGPNDYLGVVDPELVAIPGAQALRSYPVKRPFMAAAPLDPDHILLSNGTEAAPSLELLSLGDGTIVSLLHDGERVLRQPELSGPYVRFVVEKAGHAELIFASMDGLRTPPIALPEPPMEILSNSKEAAPGLTSPLRMAVVFDNPLGELSVIAGLPPANQYSAIGYLATAVWTASER